MKKKNFIVKDEKQRYGIRKIAGRAASVLLGTTLLGIMTYTKPVVVHADTTQATEQNNDQQDKTKQGAAQGAAASTSKHDTTQATEQNND